MLEFPVFSWKVGIGADAFNGCGGLGRVEIPEGVTSIGASAFNYCLGLTAVVIPDSVASIGQNAFYYCDKLATVSIGDGVTSIGDHAFECCWAVKTVTIPQHVCGRGLSSVFSGAYGSITNVVLTKGVTSIGANVFNNCSGLTEFTIPASVTSVGNKAFNGCSNLRTITLLGDVFTGVEYLPWSTLGRVYYSIAYENNWGPIFEQYDIEEVMALELLDYDIREETIGKKKWRYYEDAGGAVIFSGGLGAAVSSVSADEELTIPETLGGLPVVEIGFAAFKGLSTLTKVDIPSTVTNIADYAFYGCISLTDIMIPVSVHSIGNRAFAYCSKLAQVEFTAPSELTNVGNAAFRGCESMDVETFALPDSVEHVGKGALLFVLPKTLGGTINGTLTLSQGAVYVISNSMTVANGVTLTVPPGTILKFKDGCSLTVSSGATLNAIGTRAQPIVFTSLKDDEHGDDTNDDGDETVPQPGDWVKICINGGTANFNYAKILYSSKNATTGAINMTSSGGNVTFSNGEIAHAAYDAIGVESGNCHVTNSVIHDCLLAFRHWTRDPIVNCVIYDCGRLTQGGGQHFYNCIFSRIIETWEAFGFPQNGTTYRNCCFWNENGSVLTAEGRQDAKTVCGKNGNIWANPRFRDPENGDFRIADNSPCVNGGDAAYAPEFDYFGQPRDGAPDIGIYEVVSETGYDLAAVALNAQDGGQGAGRPTVIGDTIAISYTVANVGREAVVDPWHDALYLVSSSSGKQYALGEPLNPGALGAGESRTFTARFAVPVVPVGQYRLRLAVNSRRMDMPEGAATENNVVVSEDEIEIAATSVDASEGVSGSVAAGASAVCAFNIPDGSGDRLLRITATSGGTSLSARGGLGFLPVDASSGIVLSFSGGEAWLSVPAGTEKVWLVLDNAGASAAAYTVDFHDGALALAGVSPSSIPSSGNVTVEIEGAGFTDDCEVSFTGAGTVVPLAVRRVSSGLLATTVDAAAFGAGGTYAVTVRKGGESKTIENALSVEKAPGKPKFWAKLDVPGSMRQGRLVQTCYIEYGNSGTADMVSPVLQVSLTGDGTLGYIDGLSGLKTLQFIAAGEKGSAGVLRPGSSHRIRFAVRAGASNKISLHTSEGSTYAPAPWTNAADYLADLSAAATRIEKLGKDSSDFAMVNECADYIRRDELPNAVIGRLTDEFGQFAIGYLIEVENQISTNVYNVVTSSSGVFCFEGLPKGRYRIRSTNVPLCESNREFEIVDSSDIVDLGTIMMSFAGEIRIHTSSFSSGESVHLESLVDGYVYRPCNADLCFNGFPSGYYAAEWSCNDGVHVRQIFYYEAGEVKEITLLRTKGNSVTVCCQEALQSEGCVAMLCNVNGLKILPFDGKEEVSFDDVENGQYVVVVRNESSDIFLVDMISLESDVVENLRVELSSDLESVTLMQSSARMNKSGQTTSVRNLSTSQYELSWWEKILYWSDDEFEDNLVAFMTHFDDIVAMKPNPPSGEYNCIHNYALYENRISRYNAIRDEFYLTFMQKFYAYRAKQAFKGAKTAEWPIEASKTLAEKYLPFGWGTAAANLIEYGKRYCAGEIAFESYAEEFDKWAVDLMSSHYDEILEMSKGVGPRARTARKLLEEWGKTGKALNYAGLAAEILNYMILSLETGDAVAAYEIAKKQLDSAWQKLEIHINDFLQYENRWAGYEKCCSEEPQKKYDPPIDNKTPSIPKSCDPNEMVGEYGVGDARYVKPGQELTYTIYFENKAGFDIADAQEVRVTNPLNEWLDWSTFEMRESAFGNQSDVALDGLTNGTSEIQMDGTNKYVRTTVEYDAVAGVATWYMRVYDPNGDSEGYPTDGSGFLPSNDDTRRGEGHITYRIKVREDAPANMVITNSASIVFDHNNPIETDPAWWNTVAGVAGVKVNGEVEGGVSDLELIVGMPYGELPAHKARVGYSFAGWRTGPNGTGRAITAQSLVQAGDSGIYASWIANEYKLRLNANGGVVSPGSKRVKYDSAIGELPTPTLTGHTFGGWYVEGKKIDAATVWTIAGNATATARWTPNGGGNAGGGIGGSASGGGSTGGGASVGGSPAGGTTGGVGATGGAGVVSDWIAGHLNTSFAKAQVVMGALYGRDGVPVGTVQVKAGKVNKKKGTVKISASATLLVDGKAKKVTAKAVEVAAGTAAATMAFKAPIGDMAFEMEADGTFRLKNGSYTMVEKSVGGNWSKSGAKVWVDVGRALPAGTIEELLPDGEPVIPKGGKWSFAKAASVKYAKDKATGAFNLVINDTKGTNRSAMKLTYTPKTGIFNGSFKIYAIQDGKLKKFTVKVSGVVVDGKGWGRATGPGGASFAVTVE